jgi:hypothetical protein
MRIVTTMGQFELDLELKDRYRLRSSTGRFAVAGGQFSRKLDPDPVRTFLEHLLSRREASSAPGALSLSMALHVLEVLEATQTQLQESRQERFHHVRTVNSLFYSVLK